MFNMSAESFGPKKVVHEFSHSYIPSADAQSKENRTPFLAYMPFDLSERDSIEALHLITDKWGDKKSLWVLRNGDKVPMSEITSSSPQSVTTQIKCREVRMSSYGKEIAVAEFFPEGTTRLSVVADKYNLENDPNMQLFKDLMKDERAFIAGNHGRAAGLALKETETKDALPEWELRNANAIHDEAAQLAAEQQNSEIPAEVPVTADIEATQKSFSLPEKLVELAAD